MTDSTSITIDFLYLDLRVCTRCQDTDTSLDEAVAQVTDTLRKLGTTVALNKINVSTEELARTYAFMSSPTIRVNGRDIQLEVKENLCESCGDLCGDDVNCRVWVYQGQNYTAPPTKMITEAILREVAGKNHGADAEDTPYIMPENLKIFYAAMQDNS